MSLIRHDMAASNALSFVKLVKIPRIMYNVNNMIADKKYSTMVHSYIVVT